MAVLGWDILLGLYYLIGLLRRFRIPSRGWIGKLPLLMLAAALVFTALYCLQIIIYDLAAVDCGFIILLLESCIQSGRFVRIQILNFFLKYLILKHRLQTVTERSIAAQVVFRHHRRMQEKWLRIWSIWEQFWREKN